MNNVSSFFDFRLLSNALSRRLLLLGCRSVSFGFSFSSWTRIETDFHESERYRCLSTPEFGVVGLLDFGVVGLEARDPERRSGKRCGETDLLSCSFLGAELAKENDPGDREGREAGEVERPLLANEADSLNVEFISLIEDGLSLIEDGVSLFEDGVSLIVDEVS